MPMTTSRPYLIRALYDWITENGCTPYMLVNALDEGVNVPQEHVQEGGRITLNLSPTAVRSLVLGNDAVEFSGRFAGVPRQILVPVGAVMGVYAKENGQGMTFGTDLAPPDPPAEPDGPGGKRSPRPRKAPGKPRLKLVK